MSSYMHIAFSSSYTYNIVENGDNKISETIDRYGLVSIHMNYCY